VNLPGKTDVDPVTEMLHGVEIVDPYRWLENQNSLRTRQWLEAQTTYARAYFDGIQTRTAVRERVTELLSIPSAAEPWNVGDRYYFLKRDSKSEQAAIVMRNGLFGEDKILVDPGSRGVGGSAAVAIAAISEDGRFLAYSVRHSGTDHSAIEILDTKQNFVLPDRLPEGYCLGLTFAPDGSGFYYSHREVDDRRPNYRAVFWHSFGTDLSQDREIFFAGEQANLFLGILHSPEAKLLVYTVLLTGKDRRTSIYMQSMQERAPRTAAKLLLCEIKDSFLPFFVRGRLLALTDFAAPNFRIVCIDMADLNPTCWQDIVPESDLRIQQFAVAGDWVFVTRSDGFSSKIEAYHLSGGTVRNIPLAPYGTVSLLNRSKTTEKLFFSYSTISKPPCVYCYDTRSEELCVWDEPIIPFDPAVIAVEEVTYMSKDGTSIPLFLAARRDLLDSGPMPTFLTGYGGFGFCVSPRFTAFATFLIEQGFLFAVPALRGGSELGEQWHTAAKREKRQNSFDDFIAAAEWLISQGRSTPGRVAIGGGSNAGLLVGAAITLRPDLFRAAVCLGPLLDMIRFHLFDFAAGWADEYGSPDDEQDFRSLLAYSPYHRVQEGVRYPAVLLISGDADTRCNPMHARKMAARLQAASSSGYPILLDYKSTWGHTPVQPLSSKIEALTDRLAFLCNELGAHVYARGSS
jgi:prolyl oligopeptidase